MPCFASRITKLRQVVSIVPRPSVKPLPCTRVGERKTKAGGLIQRQIPRARCGSSTATSSGNASPRECITQRRLQRHQCSSNILIVGAVPRKARQGRGRMLTGCQRSLRVLLLLLLCTAALLSNARSAQSRRALGSGGGAAAAGRAGGSSFQPSSFKCSSEPNKKARVCFLENIFIYQGQVWFVAGRRLPAAIAMLPGPAAQRFAALHLFCQLAADATCCLAAQCTTPYRQIPALPPLHPTATASTTVPRMRATYWRFGDDRLDWLQLRVVTPSTLPAGSESAEVVDLSVPGQEVYLWSTLSVLNYGAVAA